MKSLAELIRHALGDPRTDEKLAELASGRRPRMLYRKRGSLVTVEWIEADDPRETPLLPQDTGAPL